jgi:hypothetical protein
MPRFHFHFRGCKLRDVIRETLETRRASSKQGGLQAPVHFQRHAAVIIEHADLERIHQQ